MLCQRPGLRAPAASRANGRYHGVVARPRQAYSRQCTSEVRLSQSRRIPRRIFMKGKALDNPRLSLGWMGLALTSTGYRTP